VSDALDRLLPVGADLLERVDAALLALGLPAGHPVIALLRRLGASPAEALRAVSTWQPAAARDAASVLRDTAERHERQRDLIAVPVGWAGAAGEGFAAHRVALVDFLAETGWPAEAGLVGRLRATATYLDEVADWLDRSRDAMARSIADVLGSAEAVRLHASDAAGAAVGVHARGDAGAAATIAAHVLTVAAEAHSGGQAIAERWAGRLDEVSYRPPSPAVRSAGETRLSH
jgi:hypothetical protein